jgi:hypothetical protein
MAVEEFTFDVEAERRADQARAGNRMNDSVSGAPDLGMTTDTPEHAEAVRKAREQPVPEPTEEVDIEKLRGENEFMRKQLGKQGNEIAELRKSAAQVDEMRIQFQAYQAQQEQAQRTQQPQQQFDAFAGISDEEMYNPQVLRRVVSDNFYNLAQATQVELDRVRSESTYAAQRTASGVSDAEERELVQENPWLKSLAGSERASAITKMAQARKQTQEAPKQAAEEAARLNARAASYVEGSDTVSGETDNAMEPALDKLRRDIHAGKYKTPADMEKALRKVGIGRYDGYGRRT